MPRTPGASHLNSPIPGSGQRPTEAAPKYRCSVFAILRAAHRDEVHRSVQPAISSSFGDEFSKQQGPLRVRDARFSRDFRKTSAPHRALGELEVATRTARIRQDAQVIDQFECVPLLLADAMRLIELQEIAPTLGQAERHQLVKATRGKVDGTRMSKHAGRLVWLQMPKAQQFGHGRLDIDHRLGQRQPAEFCRGMNEADVGIVVTHA